MLSRNTHAGPVSLLSPSVCTLIPSLPSPIPLFPLVLTLQSLTLLISSTSQALQYKQRRLWGLSNRPQTEAVSNLKMNPWKLREIEPRYAMRGGSSEEGWLQNHMEPFPTPLPGFSSPRAPSHLYKAPESNMSAVMLLWPWVRLGPWCLKMYPASVPSLSGIGRTSPLRVGGLCSGRLEDR